MSFKTDLGRVIGLGSAREGVHHWWSQRITAVALVPLAVLFIWSFVPLIGSAHADIVAAYQNPLTALIAILFIAVAMSHLRLGLQVVIEDYVHGKAAKLLFLLANIMLTWTLTLAGIFSVAKIAFGA